MKNHGRESIPTLEQTVEQHRQGWGLRGHLQPHLTAELTQRRKVTSRKHPGARFPKLTAVIDNGCYSAAMGRTLCHVLWALTGSANL